MKIIYRGLGIVSISFFAWLTVRAADIPQAIQSIPAAVDPGLISKRLEKPLARAPLATIPTKRVEAPNVRANSAEAKIKFKLEHVTFIGNTAFSTYELEAIFKPFYQKTISLLQFKDLVNDVSKKYRAAGYILSRAIIPPQTIKSGVVKVQLIEGFVSHVSVSGKAGSIGTVFEKYAAPILKSHPLRLQTMERSLLLMNDLPGASVKAVITPSETIPAAADLELVSNQKRMSAYISYDNYGTRYIGPQEIGLGVTLNSFTLPGASDSFRAMTVAQTSELEYLEYTHTNPLGSKGTKLTVGGNYANTQPEFVLSGFNIVGRSELLYADISFPWIRSRSSNLYLHTTANYQNVSSTILGFPFYADYIRSLVLGAEYNSVDSWHGVNDIKLDAERGFTIFGANKHLLQSRIKGEPKYTKFNLTLSRIQSFPWQLSLLAATHGQYSCNPLLATEQFAYGGPDYGRGYDPSEIVGDDGVGFKLELRRDAGFPFKWLAAVQYYLFYDAGIIWNRDGVDLPPKLSATSMGAGARFNFIPQLSGNLFIAKPLTHSINTQVLMGKDPLKPRAFFQLTFSV